MTKHFVTFYSAGTFVYEATTRPIDSWDVPTAVDMSKTVVERYNSTPYSFRFTTREYCGADLDSAISARSPLYYLRGRIETREQVEARNDPNEQFLRDNMRCNKIDRVWVTDAPFRTVHLFHATDVLLNEESPHEDHQA